MIKVTVKDSFHLSGIGQFRKGDQPEFSEKMAKELEDKGLVTISGKATGAPENKMLSPEGIANKEAADADLKAKREAKAKAKADAKKNAGK